MSKVSLLIKSRHLSGQFMVLQLLLITLRKASTTSMEHGGIYFGAKLCGAVSRVLCIDSVDDYRTSAGPAAAHREEIQRFTQVHWHKEANLQTENG